VLAESGGRSIKRGGDQQPRRPRSSDGRTGLESVSILIQEIEMPEQTWIGRRDITAPESSAKVDDGKNFGLPDCRSRRVAGLVWRCLRTFDRIANEDPAGAKAKSWRLGGRVSVGEFNRRDPAIQEGLNKMWSGQNMNWPAPVQRNYQHQNRELPNSS